jgi:hypothetical protein
MEVMQAQKKRFGGLAAATKKLSAPGRLWLAQERSKYMRIVLIRNIWMQNNQWEAARAPPPSDSHATVTAYKEDETPGSPRARCLFDK